MIIYIVYLKITFQQNNFKPGLYGYACHVASCLQIIGIRLLILQKTITHLSLPTHTHTHTEYNKPIYESE